MCSSDLGTGPAVKGCQEYGYAGNQINREEVVFSFKPYVPAPHGPAPFIRWSLPLNLSRTSLYMDIRDNEEGSARIFFRCAAPYHYLIKPFILHLNHFPEKDALIHTLQKSLHAGQLYAQGKQLRCGNQVA